MYVWSEKFPILERALGVNPVLLDELVKTSVIPSPFPFRSSDNFLVNVKLVLSSFWVALDLCC